MKIDPKLAFAMESTYGSESGLPPARLPNARCLLVAPAGMTPAEAAMHDAGLRFDAAIADLQARINARDALLP